MRGEAIGLRAKVSIFALLCLILAACAPATPVAFRATAPPALTQPPTAPLYTATLTFTPSPTRPTATTTPSSTATPTVTLTFTPSRTPTITRTPTATLSPTATITLTRTNTPVTPPAALESVDAALTASEGWSCGDFPCADDLRGWLRRLSAPPGFVVEPVGRFPGQPGQIAYGRDGRLYATLLEDGTRSGAVWVMDASGAAARYSTLFFSPLGLAFAPGTDDLYVSARITPMQGGGVWRIPAGGGAGELIIGDLPCCFMEIDNQPNGMTFGADGALYLGVGSLTDHGANPPRSPRPYAQLHPLEASVLRVDVAARTVEVYAAGLRNPFDVAFDSGGTLYASDNGMVNGVGDRVLRLTAGAHYGFPYYGSRGCGDCPPAPPGLRIQPDWLPFPRYTLPRGITAYTGAAFPLNWRDSLFVALWNSVEGGQRIIRVDPARVGQEGYTPQAFVTGLIRPIDVTIAPDGALVVLDSVYGWVWKVRYAGG